MHDSLLWVLSALVLGWDLLARRVPNSLLFVFAVLQCVVLALGLSPVSLAWGFSSAALGFACLIPFYALRLMGAGDVKFAALLGFICGWKVLFFAWLIGSVVAGLHAGITLMVRSRLDLSMASQSFQVLRFYQWCHAYREGRTGLPYAAYLAFGACVAEFVVKPG